MRGRNDIFITFAIRGDNIKMLTDALRNIPSDREDISGDLCYLRNEIAGQTGVEKVWDTSNWTDKDRNKFFDKVSK